MELSGVTRLEIGGFTMVPFKFTHVHGVTKVFVVHVSEENPEVMGRFYATEEVALLAIMDFAKAVPAKRQPQFPGFCSQEMKTFLERKT